MAGPVLRDEVNALEERMTIAESETRDLSARFDGAIAAVRRDIRDLRQEVASLASLRGDILALNTEMEDIQETLRGQGKTLASHSEMLASHSEMHASHSAMLREILEILKAPGRGAVPEG